MTKQYNQLRENKVTSEKHFWNKRFFYLQKNSYLFDQYDSRQRQPSLPLRDIVVFPGMIAPLFVGRDKSIKALNEVMKTNKKIVLITQKNAEKDDPTDKDLYSFGCESKVLQ